MAHADWLLRGLDIELLDIECALCHMTGVQFDKNIRPYKSAILDFLQKLPFAFAQNVLGRANFALINTPFCGDNFLTIKHEIGARILSIISMGLDKSVSLSRLPAVAVQTCFFHTRQLENRKSYFLLRVGEGEKKHPSAQQATLPGAVRGQYEFLRTWGQLYKTLNYNLTSQRVVNT